MIPEFQHAAVRDLAWVMSSPSLLAEQPGVVSDAYCQLVYQENRDWLMALDRDPGELNEWLKRCPSSRLGIYFEQLVACWLRSRIAGTYCESHLRVYRDKRVLGEFDFLFTEPASDALLHWETAVKFYLQFQQANHEVLFYGPNARDRLDLKLARMLQHQLRLGELPEGKALLLAEGFKRVTPNAFFKGYLFYPAESDWQNPDSLPAGIAATHLKGWWTRLKNLNVPGLINSDGGAGVRWCILPRLEWLAPCVRQEPDDRLFNPDRLLKALHGHFTRSRRPVLVAVMNRSGDTRWQELSRGFIVCDSWPEIPA